MRKTIIIVSAVLVVLIGLIIAAEASAPKKIDWTFSASVTDKRPLGLYIFDREAKHFFKGQDIQQFNTSPYEYIDGLYDYDQSDYTVKGTYLKITAENEMDDESARSLLNYADYGNTVFLSMPEFPQIILDTLGLTVATHKNRDTLNLSLADNNSMKYEFAEGRLFTYFDSLKVSNDSITIKGYQKNKKAMLPNFVEAKFGYGRIILHTQPAAFTNYYLLKDDYYKYTESVLAGIPKGAVLWQVGNATYQDKRSKLSYFLNQPAFRAFWYLGLLALLIFIFFNARRRQRVVPVINPVTNTTIDFAKTIGNLYFQEGDHHTIIDKKIIYFLEHVRNEYLIDTFSLDEKFIERLHLKSGKSINDITTAVGLIKKHRNNFTSTANDLAAINKAIEKLRL
ncbi:DUF4350 domain-containing protein [Flavobacterium sp. RHBU_24]|uniref:DUF4350 domain-containing protein n=1 Tax=Flavobacterium sp. RHBU_24 TaxID=3391185 RepID=UPI003984E5F3